MFTAYSINNIRIINNNNIMNKRISLLLGKASSALSAKTTVMKVSI